MIYQDFYPEEESVEEKRWSWVGEINQATGFWLSKYTQLFKSLEKLVEM